MSPCAHQMPDLRKLYKWIAAWIVCETGTTRIHDRLLRRCDD